MDRNNTIEIKAKTLKIKLFGRDLILRERSAQDVLDVAEFSEQNPDSRGQIIAVAQCTADALKSNWEHAHFFKKRRLKKLLSTKKLLKSLTRQELEVILNIINEIEGNKKKESQEKQSEGKSQDI